MHWLKRGIIFSIIFCLILPFIALLRIEAQAETFYCIVQKDTNIPYNYQFLKTELLARSGIDIKLSIKDGSEGKDLEIRFVTGDPRDYFSVNGKTLIYYLGVDFYSTTNTAYKILGPEWDPNKDVEVPTIFALFMRAKSASQTTWNGYAWDQYTWDTNARITRITISTNDVKIKYLKFLNELGEEQGDSQDYSAYTSFAETGWQNLTLTTSDPIISTTDDTLYLRGISPSYIPPGAYTYPYPYTYPYQSYSPYYNSYLYGNSPYSSYSYGNFPGVFYGSSPLFLSYLQNYPGSLPGISMNPYSSLYTPYSSYTPYSLYSPYTYSSPFSSYSLYSPYSYSSYSYHPLNTWNMGSAPFYSPSYSFVNSLFGRYGGLFSGFY